MVVESSQHNFTMLLVVVGSQLFRYAQMIYMHAYLRGQLIIPQVVSRENSCQVMKFSSKYL